MDPSEHVALVDPTASVPPVPATGPRIGLAQGTGPHRSRPGQRKRRRTSLARFRSPSITSQSSTWSAGIRFGQPMPTSSIMVANARPKPTRSFGPWERTMTPAKPTTSTPRSTFPPTLGTPEDTSSSYTARVIANLSLRRKKSTTGRTKRSGSSTSGSTEES